jgi:excisionase family DNA binding protein
VNRAPATSQEARIIALLERIAAGLEGLREDLGSAVELLAALSNGRVVDAGSAGDAAMDEHYRLLTPAEVADLLRVDTRTLRDLRRAGGAPPSVQVGSRPRWRRVDVDTWLGERRGTP